MGIKTVLGLKKPKHFSKPTISLEEYRNVVPCAQMPKELNFVWVGDETKRPDHCINSWREHHPDWTIRVWGNQEYETLRWQLKSRMEAIWPYELNGVADLMRWEILATHGGIAIDADSFCLQPLPDWLLQSEAVCASENEVEQPGMLATGFLGCAPNNPFFRAMVEALAQDDSFMLKKRFLRKPRRQRAWIAVGPRFMTSMLEKTRYPNMTVLPSHFFYPDYKRGQLKYSGGGPVYAYQFWGSTFVDDLDDPGPNAERGS